MARLVIKYEMGTVREPGQFSPIIKYTKKNIVPKALSALLLRGICEMKQKDICSFIGSITLSHAAKLWVKKSGTFCIIKESIEITVTYPFFAFYNYQDNLHGSLR